MDKREFYLMVDNNSNFWISEWDTPGHMKIRTDFELFSNISGSEKLFILEEGEIKIKTSLENINKAKRELTMSSDSVSKEIEATVIVKSEFR